LRLRRRERARASERRTTPRLVRRARVRRADRSEREREEEDGR
jgi:hypothetical protein